MHDATDANDVNDENDITSAASLTPQLKQCGHNCYPSSTLKCCACEDIRPHLEGDLYPSYIDGVGWVNKDSRDAGYCPICNPKSYRVWMKRLETTREEKEKDKRNKEILRIEAEKVAMEDQLRAAQNVVSESVNTTSVVSFTYSNGDQYVGQMSPSGEREGRGIMTYSDGVVYDGEWVAGLHEGHGTKNWCDGIEYVGEWKGGMMHGKGRYTMSDGTVTEGEFEEDEFVGY